MDTALPGCNASHCRSVGCMLALEPVLLSFVPLRRRSFEDVSCRPCRRRNAVRARLPDLVQGPVEASNASSQMLRVGRLLAESLTRLGGLNIGSIYKQPSSVPVITRAGLALRREMRLSPSGLDESQFVRRCRTTRLWLWFCPKTMYCITPFVSRPAHLQVLAWAGLDPAAALAECRLCSTPAQASSVNTLPSHPFAVMSEECHERKSAQLTRSRCSEWVVEQRSWFMYGIRRSRPAMHVGASITHSQYKVGIAAVAPST